MGNIKKRQPVTIGKVLEETADKLMFMAKGEDGHNNRWAAWDAGLFPIIKASEGKTLDCETTGKENDNGGVWWSVWQIFIDGKPVAEKKTGGYQKGGGFKGNYDDQKRAEIIAHLWTAGVIEKADELVTKRLRPWLDKLGQWTPAASPAPQAKPAGEPAKKETPQSKTAPPPAAAPPITPPLAQGPRHFTDAGAFLTACWKELHLNRKQVLETRKAGTPDELGDLDKAFAELQKAQPKLGLDK